MPNSPKNRGKGFVLDATWWAANGGQEGCRFDGTHQPTILKAVAASLTWLGERLYYLAAAAVPPFDDQDVLIDEKRRAAAPTSGAQIVSARDDGFLLPGGVSSRCDPLVRSPCRPADLQQAP